MIHKVLKNLNLKLFSVLLFSFIIFGDVLSFQASKVLNDFENNLKPANSSENYFVFEKKLWSEFKEDFKAEQSKIINRQDSLSKIMRQQADSLLKFKNSSLSEPLRVHKDLTSKQLPWVLCVFLGLLVIVGLGYLLHLNSRLNNYLEQSQNSELNYQKSKGLWIDRERQLKRELLNANIKLEEYEKKQNEL
ncbi:hypothetical protein [Belliella aquatica]|uniref:Uncharacterized protein n=1 Tax=Belliella aquatica TaxID=1323734 RepID=A0ABQ1N9D8_9BACT|nr:hypothetical protein [Belliella aquatica]MCH7407680.1 hypothetical protein [Belliella aquatica]GGC54990.1 hypothetical protein GCM10010993_36700 [Belliella aquatica]